MEKILINLEVPSVKKNFDVFVPPDLEIKELCGVLSNGVYELCNGRYGISGNEMLIRVVPPALLNPEKSLMEYCVNDGAKLILL